MGTEVNQPQRWHTYGDKFRDVIFVNSFTPAAEVNWGLRILRRRWRHIKLAQPFPASSSLLYWHCGTRPCCTDIVGQDHVVLTLWGKTMLYWHCGARPCCTDIVGQDRVVLTLWGKTVFMARSEFILLMPLVIFLLCSADRASRYNLSN